MLFFEFQEGSASGAGTKVEYLECDSSWVEDTGEDSVCVHEHIKQPSNDVIYKKTNRDRGKTR